MSVDGITRRDLFRRGGLLALPAFSGAAWPRPSPSAPPPRPPPAAGPACASAPTSTSRSACGPLVNARGTYTIISGSTHAARGARGDGRGRRSTTCTSTS